MVDLDCGDLAKPPPAEKDEFSTSQNTPNVAKHLCRLCLHDVYENENFLEIFSDAEIVEMGNKGLDIVLYELFQIKYDRNCHSLPHIICQRCREMVQAFSRFRQIVQKCEETLQKRLEVVKSTDLFQIDNKRPGLNGTPGLFVPENDCEIEEVNPDQEFESSEDDFSMESDSEPEDSRKVIQQEIGTLTSNTLAMSKRNAMGPKTPILNDIQQSKDIPGLLSEHKGLEFTIKNTYLCQYCDMAFATQQEKLEHESGHDSNMPYVCNFCMQAYHNRQTLILHIKKLHDPEKPYICALCSKGFCRRSDLKKHTIVHTGVRPFSCPLCTKCFSRNTNLYKHMRIHSSVKPFVCQQCPRSFGTGTELLRHARSHSEVKNFKCSRCPASYARKDKLLIHEQTHHKQDSDMMSTQQAQSLLAADEPGGMIIPVSPFIQSELNQLKQGDAQERIIFHNSNCPPLSIVTQFPSTIASVTGNASAPISLPKSHVKSSHPRIHTCDICEKTFTRERDLQRHQALHLDTLFTCKQCGVGFSRREKLARHELEQHGPQYPCEICRITFHKKDELDIHLKMHELQHNSTISAHQAALNAAGVARSSPMEITPLQAMNMPVLPPTALPVVTLPQQRPSAADISFYSQMVPTMNLGFYSETRPEDRNDI